MRRNVIARYISYKNKQYPTTNTNPVSNQQKKTLQIQGAEYPDQ